MSLEPQAECHFCWQPRTENQYWCSIIVIEADEFQGNIDFKLCQACYKQLERSIWQMLRQNLQAEVTLLQANAQVAGLKV